MAADGYAPKTVAKPFRPLKQALKWAVGQDLLTKNACDFCKPPKQPHDARQGLRRTQEATCCSGRNPVAELWTANAFFRGAAEHLAVNLIQVVHVCLVLGGCTIAHFNKNDDENPWQCQSWVASGACAPIIAGSANAGRRPSREPGTLWNGLIASDK